MDDDDLKDLLILGRKKPKSKSWVLLGSIDRGSAKIIHGIISIELIIEAGININVCAMGLFSHLSSSFLNLSFISVKSKKL